MNQLEPISKNFDTLGSRGSSEEQILSVTDSKFLVFKKLRGGCFFVIGYLLSPLSWWNDLFFNLPVAYGFGYLCSRFSADWFLPSAIAGYWLSNVLGILLMQAGVIDVFQGQPKERNFQKELLTGVATSTAYTLLIVLLVQFKVLELPTFLFEDGVVDFSALLNLWGSANS